MGNESDSPSSGPLVDFYLGKRPDSSGRLIQEIREWGLDRLEHTHDYIQWLFPTRNRSQYNSVAPTLDEEQIRDFRYDERLQAEMRASFNQMLGFYGFALQENESCLVVVRSSQWETRRIVWLSPGNHNFLRITRILACMRTIGFRDHASALLGTLESVDADFPNVIGGRTLGFWRSAAK